MGEGEKRMRIKDKIVRKIVVNNIDGTKVEREFNDSRSANNYWHSLFVDLDEVKTIDVYIKFKDDDIYIKRAKYIKEKDLLKML